MSFGTKNLGIAAKRRTLKAQITTPIRNAEERAFAKNCDHCNLAQEIIVGCLYGGAPSLLVKIGASPLVGEVGIEGSSKAFIGLVYTFLLFIASKLGLSIRIRILCAEVGLLIIPSLDVLNLCFPFEYPSGKALASAVSTSTNFPFGRIPAVSRGCCSTDMLSSEVICDEIVLVTIRGKIDAQ